MSLHKNCIAVDTETTGFDTVNDTLLTVNFYSYKLSKELVLKHPEHKVLIQKILRTTAPKVYFNAKFDIAFLRNAGYQIRGEQLDAAIYARVRLTSEPSYSLKALSRKYLGENYEEATEIQELLKKENSRCCKLPLSDSMIELVNRVHDNHIYTGFPHLLQDIKPRLYKRFQGAKITKGIVNRIRSLHNTIPADSKWRKYIDELYDHVGPGGFYCIPYKLLKKYGGKDAKCTMLLLESIDSICNISTRRVLAREHITIPIVVEMENRGMRVDVKYAKKLLKTCIRLRKILGKKIQDKLPEINIRSSTQLADALFDTEGFYAPKPTRLTDKDKISTNALALIERGGKLSRYILKWRKLDKAISTYLIPLVEKTGKDCTIRPSFNQNGARTGRWSSNNPNLQNIPRAGSSAIGHVRNCFIAREGMILLFIDYDQIELRLAAHFAGEEHMVDAIWENEDLHGLTCKKIFKIDETSPDWKIKRQIAKTQNFASLYGAGPDAFRDALMLQSGIVVSNTDAVQYINEFKNAYPGIVKLFRSIEDTVKYNGSITNPFNRSIDVPKKEPYKGVNYLIQSTSADLMQERLNTCYTYLKSNCPNSHILATVHDEIIFEVPEDQWKSIYALQEIMEEKYRFRVPLTCSIAKGKVWGKKKNITAQF